MIHDDNANAYILLKIITTPYQGAQLDDGLDY